MMPEKMPMMPAPEEMDPEKSGVHPKVEGAAFSPEEQAFFDKANDNKLPEKKSADNKELFETGEFNPAEKSWMENKK